MRRNLNIFSEVINIRVVENTIDEISTELNIGSDDYGKILVATLEAVNNAIIHGNKVDNSKSVKIGFEYKTQNLTVTVADEGPGFIPDNVPDPTSPENIENLHGRGVFLMKNLCDQISFNDLGNEVKMKFKIH
jgi:serine/threonine-protein kinase RsbW